MQQYESGTQLSDYLKVIKNRKSIIATFFFVTVFVVTIASFMAKPVYMATVTLLIDMESPNVLTATDPSVTLGPTNYYAYKEYFQSQVEIIKSRSIARQVLNELDLNKTEEYKNAEDPVKDLLEKVKTEEVDGTRLLLLHVFNRDPQQAADIANSIARVYIERNLAYITQSEVMNLLKNEYLKLQARLSEYSKIYKDKHPQMIRLKEEIEQMASRIKGEKERAEGNDLTGASSYSSALGGLKANNITVQDRAETPLKPVKPQKRLNILLAMIVGFFGGTGLAFFMEYMDDTVKGAEDIEKFVGWPYLGSIADINGTGNMTEEERDIFVHNKPKDPASEAYRAIRTSVLFCSTEEHPLKTVIITSAGPREGKTTTLCNLGIAMAQGQKQVLLVDADMRKPRLHEIFDDKNEIGLSSFLSGQTEFKKLVQNTKVPNVFLVSGGPHPPNPSELLDSSKMKEFIEQAYEKFDFILFDTPPVAVVTDAVVLSQITDGTIMVVESAATNKRTLPRINRILKDVRARVLGVIINKVSISHSPYSYSYYYGKQKHTDS